MRRAGFEPDFAGLTIEGVPGNVLPVITRYLLRLPEMVAKGRGLALCGGQGTRKTGTLALLAQAVYTFLPPPFAGEGGLARPEPVIYRRMPRLLRFLGQYVGFEQQPAWDTEFRQLCRVPFLLVDEFHVHTGGDRGADMLLELMDIRSTAPVVTCFALNGLWRELTNSPHPVLRQIREKLAPRTRQVLFTGESCRADGWEL